MPKSPLSPGEVGCQAAVRPEADLGRRALWHASQTGARFLQGRIVGTDAAGVLHPRRRLDGRQQGPVQRERVSEGRHLSCFDRVPLHLRATPTRCSRRSSGRCTTPLAPCNSSAARPRSGTSTRPASAPRAGRPGHAPACGWPSTTTWPIPRAPIRSPANPPA